MSASSNQADALLRELYDAGNSFLIEYPWEFEEDRWIELVVCSLMVAGKMGSEDARNAVSALRQMGMLSIDTLASLSPERQAFVSQILKQFGCETEASTTMAKSISLLAQVVQKTWDGHIQRFLRDHGTLMLDQLGSILGSAGLGEKATRKIALVWLQNVANIPLLMTDDVYVQAFCKEHQLTDKELVSTADRLGLNLSVLDDLLALEAAAASQDDRSKKLPKKVMAKAAGQA